MGEESGVFELLEKGLHSSKDRNKRDRNQNLIFNMKFFFTIFSCGLVSWDENSSISIDEHDQIGGVAKECEYIHQIIKFGEIG